MTQKFETDIIYLKRGMFDDTWNSDNCILDCLSKESFCCFFHLDQNHSTDLLRTEDLGLPIFDFNLDIRFPILVNNLIGNKFHVPLYFFVFKPVTDINRHYHDYIK